MAKDSTKVLKFIASKIEIGISTGTEPGSYTEIGTMDEVPVKIELKKITAPTGDLSEIQKAYEATIETSGLEIMNVSTLETTFKNQQVWLKCTPVGTVSATNPLVRVLNFMANFEAVLDLSVKGKTLFKITGTKAVSAFADFVTTAGS